MDVTIAGVATISPASRLLAAAAREILRPMGVQQRGRSRVWLDDHTWWLVVVEFQPSSWSQGSYLNVGAMWLWHDRSHLSFDVGYRERAHERFLNETQFAEAARSLSVQAAELVRGYRRQFTDLAAVVRQLTAGIANPGLWDAYHAGIAAGLVGDVELARRWFARVAETDGDAPSMVDLRRLAGDLGGLVADRDVFRQRMTGTVRSCRQSLKLEPREVILA
jgi:hypothetical protein